MRRPGRRRERVHRPGRGGLLAVSRAVPGHVAVLAGDGGARGSRQRLNVSMTIMCPPQALMLAALELGEEPDMAGLLQEATPF